MITPEILDVLSNTLNKLTGIATDGAAVMTGKKSGVVQRLKEICPYILSTHSIAHRFALGPGGTADTLPCEVETGGFS